MPARGSPWGLTLPELLIALAVVALLAALATPSFRELRRRAGLSAAVNQMVGALHYARSVAILRSVPTVVCLTADGSQCVEREDIPAHGWLVFSDLERSSPVRLDAGDELLRTYRLSSGLTATGTRTALTFWPVTRAGTTGTFTFCSAARQPRGRAVVVSRVGRPRAVQGEVPCQP